MQVPPAVQAAAKGGTLSVTSQRWLHSGHLRITLDRDGETAALDGAAVENVPAETLGDRPLEPGVYQVRFRYRGREIENRSVEVRGSVHAVLNRQADGGYTLVDMGSSNGTTVNDETKRVAEGESRALEHGDEIHLGAWTTITILRDPEPE